MNQPCIDQPLQCILIFTGSGTFFDYLIDELLVFASQLRWNGFPEHRDFRELTSIGMLRKIPLIGIDNAGKRLLHGRNITGFCPHEHRLRHTTGDIIHLQFLIERIKKCIWDGFKRINAIEICCQIFISIRKQKFREGHWIDLHEVHLAHRKRGGLRQRNPQQ